MGLSGKLDTLHDVGHGSRSVRAENLDRVDVCLLSNTILLTTDGTGAVSSVAVSILIRIAGGDGLAPVSTALEVDVFDVRAGVDDVDIDTLTSVGLVNVLVEVAKVQTLLVRDTGETPGSRVLGNGVIERIHERVFLNVGNLESKN